MTHVSAPRPFPKGDTAESVYLANLRDQSGEEREEYEHRALTYAAHLKWAELSLASKTTLLNDACESLLMIHKETHVLEREVEEAHAMGKLMRDKETEKASAAAATPPPPTATPLVPYSPPPPSAKQAVDLDAIVGRQVAVRKSALDAGRGLVHDLENLLQVVRKTGLSDDLVQSPMVYNNNKRVKEAGGVIPVDSSVPTSAPNFLAIAAQHRAASVAQQVASKAPVVTPSLLSSPTATTLPPPPSTHETMDTKHSSTKRPVETNTGDSNGEPAAKKQKTTMTTAAAVVTSNGVSHPSPSPPPSPPTLAPVTTTTTTNKIDKKKKSVPPLRAMAPPPPRAPSPKTPSAGIRASSSSSSSSASSSYRSSTSSSLSRSLSSSSRGGHADKTTTREFTGFRPRDLQPPKLDTSALQALPVDTRLVLMQFAEKMQTFCIKTFNDVATRCEHVYSEHLTSTRKEMEIIEKALLTIRSDFGVWSGRKDGSSDNDVAVSRRLDEQAILLTSLQKDVDAMKAHAFLVSSSSSAAAAAAASDHHYRHLNALCNGGGVRGQPTPNPPPPPQMTLPPPAPLKVLTAKEHLSIFKVPPPSAKDRKLVAKILKMASDSKCKRIAVDFDAVVASADDFKKWAGTDPVATLRDEPVVCTSCLPWLAELQMQLARQDQTLFFYTSRPFSNGAQSQNFVDYYFFRALATECYDAAARLKICNTIFNVNIVDGKTKKAHEVLNNIIDVGGARTVDMFRAHPEVVKQIPEHAREFATVHSTAKRQEVMKSTEALWRTVVEAVRVRAEIEEGIDRHADADDDPLGSSSSGGSGDGFQVFFIFGSTSSIASIRAQEEDAFEELPWQVTGRHIIVDHNFNGSDPHCIPADDAWLLREDSTGGYVDPNEHTDSDNDSDNDPELQALYATRIPPPPPSESDATPPVTAANIPSLESLMQADSAHP